MAPRFRAARLDKTETPHEGRLVDLAKRERPGRGVVRGRLIVDVDR